MELRETIARAASRAIAEQDGMEGDGLEADLTTSYLDQGVTDFGQVADAILLIPEISEALALRAAFEAEGLRLSDGFVVADPPPNAQ